MWNLGRPDEFDDLELRAFDVCLCAQTSRGTFNMRLPTFRPATKVATEPARSIVPPPRDGDKVLRMVRKWQLLRAN